MRMSRGWALLLAVAFGILVAVVLICTVPLYTTLVGDVQLQQTLGQTSAIDRNIQIQVRSQQVVSGADQATSSRVGRLALNNVSGFVADASTYYVVSDPMLLVQVGSQTFNASDPRARQVTFDSFDFAAAAPHMTYLAGGAPGADDVRPQVVVDPEMASTFNLTVGSSLTVTEFGDHTKQVVARVAGVWQPSSASDPYWNGLDFNPNDTSPAVFPILMSTSGFFGRLAQFSDVGMQQTWIYYTQTQRINGANSASVANDVAEFRQQLNSQLSGASGVTSVALNTQLDTTIGSVQEEQSLLALPLYIIVSQVVGLALLFVVTMSGLLIEHQGQDIATLKSRGASGTQVLTTFTIQGVLLSLLALIAGPFAAAALSLALVEWFIPASARGGASAGYLSELSGPSSVAVPAAFGALLGVAAICLTAWQSSRRDVLAFRREQGRASGVAFWRRYYLDVALAVICIAGYLELSTFGAVTTRQQLGVSSSPLLLAAPALLLVSGALVVLRLFPLGAALGARFAARARGATALLSLAQVERSPGRYSRLTLLLVLAVGLGLFALTFDSSLVRNAADRAAYTVGADVRVSENVGLGNGQDAVTAAHLASLPGVTTVSPVYRTTASVTQDEGGSPVDVLAVDPATLGRVVGPVSWRSDYAGESLPSLLDGMQRHALGAAAGTSDAPIWAIVSSAFATRYHLVGGEAFALQFDEAGSGTAAFVVGAIVADFPTLYPTHASGGFVLASSADYFAGIVNVLAKANAGGASTGSPTITPSNTTKLGANEFWLRTDGNAQHQAALLKALSQPDPAQTGVLTLGEAQAEASTNPISTGMRGLLLVGAITAALLAILGSVVQSLLAARQRATQFAVLRTIGMSARQLAGLLLGEQVVVYLFGLLGGTLLGLLLVTATLPYLQFSDAAVDPSQLGIPPYQLAFSAQGILLFYLALLVAFALALLVAARYASTIGIGKALRIGED
jgi:putative ABC transport system permease protein